MEIQALSYLKKILTYLRSLIRRHMGLIDNIDNVAFTTTLNNDKVVEIFTGSFAAPGFATTRISIAHDWGANVLPFMIWSKDQTTWLDAGAPIFSGSSVTTEQLGICDVSSTTITVSCINSISTSITMYYKIALISVD